jgi:sulfatase maturation enzyme AslB (radical SAM superfamily)
MVKEIIEELFKEAENNDAKLVSFSLFGGEPTINWDCVVKAVEVADEMTFNTGIKCIKAIVTNGAMETYKTEYISRNFDNIYFSLDGPKELFLKQRKPKSGDYIFDVIYNNALLVYNSGANISFKSTFTKHTIDKMFEVDEFFTLNFPFAGRLFQPVMVEETSDLYISFDELLSQNSIEPSSRSFAVRFFVFMLYVNCGLDHFSLIIIFSLTSSGITLY